MNPISYALNHLRQVIPSEILRQVFMSRINYNYDLSVSLDTRIREEVIFPVVMFDCNLIGGLETWIRLLGLPREQVDLFTHIYRIPKTMTQGRSIISALSVSYGEGAVVGATNLIPVRGNSLLDAASGLLSSSNPIPMISTAKVQLVGENVVAIMDNLALPTNIFLRCWLENDTEMNHINPRSYLDFARLCEYAVKRYIYTNAIIPMDKGELFAGSQLGRFKEIIDSYSDADEMYFTAREEWGRIAALNDFESQRRHIELITGGLW